MRPHFYCFIVFAKMHLGTAEILHGLGQFTQRQTLMYMYWSCCKHSAEVCSLCLWPSLFAYKLPLSFKELLFSQSEYANLASIVIQSHPVFTALDPLPDLCFPKSLSASVWLLFKTESRQTYQILPPGFLCEQLKHVVIFALPGDYTPLRGLPSLLKHPATERHSTKGRVTFHKTFFWGSLVWLQSEDNITFFLKGTLSV